MSPDLSDHTRAYAESVAAYSVAIAALWLALAVPGVLSVWAHTFVATVAICYGLWWHARSHTWVFARRESRTVLIKCVASVVWVQLFLLEWEYLQSARWSVLPVGPVMLAASVSRGVAWREARRTKQTLPMPSWMLWMAIPSISIMGMSLTVAAALALLGVLTV